MMIIRRTKFSPERSHWINVQVCAPRMGVRFSVSLGSTSYERASHVADRRFHNIWLPVRQTTQGRMLVLYWNKQIPFHKSNALWRVALEIVTMAREHHIWSGLRLRHRAFFLMSSKARIRSSDYWMGKERVCWVFGRSQKGKAKNKNGKQARPSSPINHV